MTLLAVFGLQACTVEVEPDSTPPYEAVTDSRTLMNWIIDPTADVIWGASGWIVTMEGEQDLTPTTQEGWDQVRNAAATMAELGNLLMMPGHAQEGDDWIELAQGLTATSKLLIDAAQRKDSEAVFNLGGTLYNVCVSCHQLYIPAETE
jgi:hypothetical protein